MQLKVFCLYMEKLFQAFDERLCFLQQTILQISNDALSDLEQVFSFVSLES